MTKIEKKDISKEISILAKLMILELYNVHGVSAELISKATGMNPNSIRNMFPKEKLKGKIKNKKKNK